MVSEKYWILCSCGAQYSAIVMGVNDDVPDLYQSIEGKSALDIYKKPVKLLFSDLYPGNVRLYDFLDNALDMVIVSARVKGLFDAIGIMNLEYIPAEVYDHGEVLVDAKYYIINPLVLLPLIELEKSKLRMFNISPNKISKIKKLVVNQDAMAEHNDSLFRARMDPSNIYITKPLLEALQDANITGLKSICADGWNGRELSLP